jgi:predicted DNA-binding protein (MmcQ/YjbR family)
MDPQPALRIFLFCDMEIEMLRKFCLSLPGVTEDIKWGHDLCFLIGGKMFCVTSFEPPLQFSFKVGEEEFEELSQRPGFQPAPYLARNKWVLATDPTRLRNSEWEAYVRKSYELIKSKLSKKLRDRFPS